MAELASVVAERWLYQTLSANATLAVLGIYSHVIPPEATLPAVVFVPNAAGSDLRGVGRIRPILTTLDYVVKVVGAGESVAPIAAAAGLVHDLLDAQSGSATGGQVLACVREQLINYPETSQGIRYHHLGGLYRLQVQPT